MKQVQMKQLKKYNVRINVFRLVCNFSKFVVFFFLIFLAHFPNQHIISFLNIDSISQARLFQSHMLMLSCIWSQ